MIRDPTDLLTDDRGLAYALILGFCAMILGAALWIILGDAVKLMHSTGANQTNSSTAATSRAYLWDLWQAMPLFILTLVVFGWIVNAAREGEIRR